MTPATFAYEGELFVETVAKQFWLELLTKHEVRTSQDHPYKSTWGISWLHQQN